jgi:hypothetical protein
MTMFTAVCILTNGSVLRFECRTLSEAQDRLDECEQMGRYASGSIYNMDDEEVAGFAA